MKINKIKLYLLLQISKYFLLILFIFLSIAWLLQITRLFTITNFLQVQVLDIIILSFYLVPNIITVILPFILIFGLLLCFLKLNRDNELIAIFSLGIGLKPLRNTLYLFTFVIIIIFTFLSFYLAPSIYGKYKTKEFDLRNNLDLNKMVFSNFLNLNNTTILDFKKINNEYSDIFISYEDERENIVYAKKGNIFNKNNQYNFQLSNGFKISIDDNEEIEKLEFQNYVLKIENTNININKIVDKNTFTIFDDLNSKNYLNISFKFVDIILIIFVVYFFYKNNIKNINFKTNNIVYFSVSCIITLIINQILKNTEILFLNYTILILLVICLSIIISNIKKKYE